jgi:hypothetical protein
MSRYVVLIETCDRSPDTLATILVTGAMSEDDAAAWATRQYIADFNEEMADADYPPITDDDLYVHAHEITGEVQG